MKRLLLISLLVVGNAGAFAQKNGIKTVRNKQAYVIEEYNVLTDDPSVRSGPYRKRLRDRDVLLEEGQYADNRRVGVWTFYQYNGDPELRYDYSADSVLLNRQQPFRETYPVLVGDSTVQVQVDRPPIHLTSSVEIGTTFQHELRFPPEMQRAGETRITVRPTVVVSSEGKSVHYRAFVNPQNRDLNAQCVAVAKHAYGPVQWLPALYKGKPVQTIYVGDAVVLVGFATLSTHP